MNFQRLEYFSVLASYLNFAQAAKKLYITQPALSKQISLLEDELGFKLFLRNKRSVSLTPEGEVCLSKTKNILYNCRDLEDWAETVRNAQLPTLRLGYYGLLIQDLVPVILQNLWKLYPAVEVFLRLQDIHTLLPSLHSGKLDAAIITATYFNQLPQIEAKKICTVDYKLVLPANHRLANRESVAFTELVEEDFILFSQQEFSRTYSETVALCETYGLSPRVTYQCADPLTMYLMIESGKCISIATARKNALKGYDVRLVDLEGAPEDLHKDILVIWSADNENKAIASLLKTIEITFRDLGPEDEIRVD